MKRWTDWAMLGLLAALLPTSTMARQAAVGGVMMPLYPKGSTDALGVPETRECIAEADETFIFNVSDPTLEIFRPARPNGTAVIVAPGGGFVGLAYEHGGRDIARRLARHGVTALVLKYRTIQSPQDAMHMPEVHEREMAAIIARAKSGEPAPVRPFAGEAHAVEDGSRAMTLVREHARAWGVDPDRIGMLGFSSGAFLAADLAIGDKVSRPAFVGLIYGGLRGPVPADAAPAFIAAAADDSYLPQDGPLLYAAWRKAGGAAELHMFERGGHGFDLRPKGATSDHWFDEFLWWMRSRGLLPEKRK